ncbi:MAG: hypothetical protein K5798_10910 [Nitrosopumilus sp.]|uniref:hypothetical protein n=1 Tax=Nitrosopumilus sp. TaxID=2024843 RepID=UPI00242A4C35|nr:hypothetical protein [Nitrosopumilus sp.]MCV0367755.1 hypothetical protein [Nitrosopumilus sp.]
MDVVLILVSWLILLVPGFDESVPPTGDKVFKIETDPDIVESIQVQSDESFDFWGLDIKLKQNSTGTLELKIPKNLPTPASFTNSWHHGEKPIMLTDGTEIGYDVIPDPCYFHYKISVEGEANLEILYSVILTDSWQLYSPIQFDENHQCYNKVFYEQSPESPLQQFQMGTIQWGSRCYSSNDVATITVIDSDMNVDSNVPDQFQIFVWSDWIEEETGKNKILPVNVIETGDSTGVFESLVFLGSAYDETSGHRIPVGIENMIFAKYVDYTVPDYDELEIIDTAYAKILSIGGTWERWEELSSLYDIPLVYDPCLKKQMDLVGTDDGFAQLDIFYPAPLKQIESGLSVDEIQCKDGLTMLLSPTDSRPICVTEDTFKKLIQRHWGILVSRG